jgi:hypothetical protein
MPIALGCLAVPSAILDTTLSAVLGIKFGLSKDGSRPPGVHGPANDDEIVETVVSFSRATGAMEEMETRLGGLPAGLLDSEMVHGNFFMRQESQGRMLLHFNLR